MACAIGLAFAGTVKAQAVVVPNIYTSTVVPGGSGLNTLIRDSGNPRTAQLLINANELTTIPVAQITGFTARMYVGNLTGFPASTATWADYTINMGPGVAFGSQTTTFASNFASGRRRRFVPASARSTHRLSQVGQHRTRMRLGRSSRSERLTLTPAATYSWKFAIPEATSSTVPRTSSKPYSQRIRCTMWISGVRRPRATRRLSGA